MKFSEVFPDRRVFLAVVHAHDRAQVLRNVRVARDNGAHGVFLINHDTPAEVLLSHFRAARVEHPDWWIGLNLLDLKPDRAFTYVPTDASGLWTDASGIDLRADDPAEEARKSAQARARRLDWHGLHFGGVAFKHQRKTGKPAEEARAALPFMDVLTTSGDETGKPPSVEKIQHICEAIAGEKPLAIASGIATGNVDAFLPLATCFLVASGISFTFTELDSSRVRLLADRIRAW